MSTVPYTLSRYGEVVADFTHTFPSDELLRSRFPASFLFFCARCGDGYAKLAARSERAEWHSLKSTCPHCRPWHRDSIPGGIWGLIPGIRDSLPQAALEQELAYTIQWYDNLQEQQ